MIAGGLDDNCCNSQNGKIKSSKKSYLFTNRPLELLAVLPEAKV